MKVCFNCTKDKPDTFEFCSNCGVRLVHIPDCKCGYCFSVEDNYCPSCGTRRLTADEVLKVYI